MVVAVRTVGTVEVTGDEVVHVVTVRHRFVTAPCTVHMVAGVSAARMLRRATRRIRGALLDPAFVDVVGVDAVQVTVVQVVGVVAVANCAMPTDLAMDVFVTGMRLVMAHDPSSFTP